jgi:hypothetical protein
MTLPAVRTEPSVPESAGVTPPTAAQPSEAPTCPALTLGPIRATAVAIGRIKPVSVA